MQQPPEFEQFAALILKAAHIIGDDALDEDLEAKLNRTLPANGENFRAIVQACQRAIAAGWMCSRSAGGIRFGRVIKPSGPLGRFSVDVVEMSDVVGPTHAHPNGEVDMIMPLDQNAKFDGRGAGWMVYPAGSRHAPTVTGGTAIILYLLPEGAIDFNAASTP
jgi:Domain of unknown function (DUF4863)